MIRTRTIVLFAAVLLVTAANAQFGGWRGGFDDGDGRGPFDDGDGGDGDSSSSSDDSSSSSTSQSSVFSSEAEFNKATRILIAHAVLASLVWVMFIPSLAILLRLNIKNPIVLKIHAIGQIFSYIIYIVAAGMGIWLAQQSAAFGIWNDAHPRLGLAILAIAFFQPIFGAIHHRLYKRRSLAVQAGKPSKPPGRTPVGRVHLWVGRLLILLAMINGGLGIRLASFSPFQTDSDTQKARIAYSVVAAIMFVLYVVFVIAFEIRRARQRKAELQNREQVIAVKDTLPTYDESEESVGRSSQYR
ncbi:uncharacterized protein Z518_11178 [Rhinocladiella mackenziei CBS 650.93]|uniref:Cytochrome b561 domain-containing protein n=1 Tax=Rhinocladiella mackenziei CBS 650.93 TaxID=1442369 RepID=A0A0D2IRT3_9EURO|nr:uncharacterized protein Z518_11178 [Rhinocladiella mackenziei CBS 650.93]KIW99439.1 hypothetical protein Z518_11178 [Rhinocladiella mackenziei CBS 650.93]